MSLSGRGSSTRVAHDTLNVFNRPLLMCQGCDRSADDLERQFRQLEFASDFVQNPLAIVVRVEEAD